MSRTVEAGPFKKALPLFVGCSEFRLCESGLIVGDEKALAALDDFVAFFFKAALEVGDAARVFGVKFAFGFEGPPVRGNTFRAGGFGFFGGVGGEPGEDARG